MINILQDYWAYFGLYSSSSMWKTKRPQRFGDWICLRPQVDWGKINLLSWAR
jgi:hypothetical protein